MMDSFVAVVGWLVVLGLVTSLAALLCISVFYGAMILVDAMKERGEHEARTRLYQQFISASHWFSEHPPTSRLMRAHADHLVQYCGGDFSGLRDEWRKDMKKEKDPT